MDLWIATGNTEKLRELVYFAEKAFPGMKILSREPQNAIENATTLLGNARIKAAALATELRSEGHLNFLVLADDSGLTVDILDGLPGVLSGRFAGESSNSEKNRTSLLERVNAKTHDIAKRTAQYRCALCLLTVRNGNVVKETTSEGTKEGWIANEPNGRNGYAYDSIFLISDSLKTYGELSFEEKQFDSHRKNAFAALNREGLV